MAEADGGGAAPGAEGKAVVRFKLKSDPAYTEVPIDDGAASIRVGSLKQAIVHAKFNGKIGAFGLKLINQTSGEEYADEDASVPADASILVKRVPMSQLRTASACDMPAKCNYSTGSVSLSSAPLPVHGGAAPMTVKTTSESSNFSAASSTNSACAAAASAAASTAAPTAASTNHKTPLPVFGGAIGIGASDRAVMGQTTTTTTVETITKTTTTTTTIADAAAPLASGGGVKPQPTDDQEATGPPTGAQTDAIDAAAAAVVVKTEADDGGASGAPPDAAAPKPAAPVDPRPLPPTRGPPPPTRA